MEQQINTEDSNNASLIDSNSKRTCLPFTRAFLLLILVGLTATIVIGWRKYNDVSKEKEELKQKYNDVSKEKEKFKNAIDSTLCQQWIYKESVCKNFLKAVQTSDFGVMLFEVGDNADIKCHKFSPNGVVEWVLSLRGIQEMPLIYDTNYVLLYLAGNNKIYVVNLNSGRIVWSKNLPGKVKSIKAGDESGLYYAYDQYVVEVNTYGNEIRNFCISADWEIKDIAFLPVGKELYVLTRHISKPIRIFLIFKNGTIITFEHETGDEEPLELFVTPKSNLIVKSYNFHKERTMLRYFKNHTYHDRWLWEKSGRRNVILYSMKEEITILSSVYPLGIAAEITIFIEDDGIPAFQWGWGVPLASSLATGPLNDYMIFGVSDYEIEYNLFGYFGDTKTTYSMHKFRNNLNVLHAQLNNEDKFLVVLEQNKKISVVIMPKGTNLADYLNYCLN